MVLCLLEHYIPVGTRWNTLEHFSKKYIILLEHFLRSAERWNVPTKNKTMDIS